MDAFTVAPIQKLSPRQMQIAALLVEGKNARQIATILSIGPETVKTHIRNACRKLNVSNRVQLIVTVARWQVIEEMQNDKR
jgi:DNA-binding CsgD family transcriptional regulator